MVKIRVRVRVARRIGGEAAQRGGGRDDATVRMVGFGDAS